MTKNPRVERPIVVIGAGPIGLAAAARLIERGLTPLVLEKGPSVGTSLRAWRHVRVFSPWEFNIDQVARELLRENGWTEPYRRALPTGGELVEDYLEPLAAHPALAQHIVLDATVSSVARDGFDKMRSPDRDEAPFAVRWRDGAGSERRTLAKAVIDASGTWGQPNPIGVDGLPVPGEAEARDLVAYGIPDILGAGRALYQGLHTLVVGSGHSAIHSVLALMQLQDAEQSTRVTWAIRSGNIGKLLGGGLNDQLPERGSLGFAAKEAIDAGRLELLPAFAADAVERENRGLVVRGRSGESPVALEVDRVVVATGFRPRLDILRELRVSLDPAVEAPPALAPLIDPNFHSCGTVPPHGAAELAHPEGGFYIVGSKSYGRAPTFLMATGYEQVRSVIAEIAGDHEAARDVRLVLPKTGVCSIPPVAAAVAAKAEGAGCCGGPAPAGVDACCVADADAKEAGRSGCGCGGKKEVRPKSSKAKCCGVPA